MSRITPTLWFGEDIEEAARFYVDLFPGSRITDVSRYPDDFPDPALRGTALVMDVELDGQLRPSFRLRGARLRVPLHGGHHVMNAAMAAGVSMLRVPRCSSLMRLKKAATCWPIGVFSLMWRASVNSTAP